MTKRIKLEPPEPTTNAVDAPSFVVGSGAQFVSDGCTGRHYAVTQFYPDGTLQVLPVGSYGGMGRVSGVHPDALRSPECLICSYKIEPEDEAFMVPDYTTHLMHAGCRLGWREMREHEQAERDDDKKQEG